MLGTIGDAEDVVQEAWLRWDAAEHSRAQLSSDAFALDPEAQALATERSQRARRELDELAPFDFYDGFPDDRRPHPVGPAGHRGRYPQSYPH